MNESKFLCGAIVSIVDTQGLQVESCRWSILHNEWVYDVKAGKYSIKEVPESMIVKEDMIYA